MLGDEVFSWLGRLPAWQGDLARRLATQVELGDAEYGDALRMVKSQFGFPVDGAPAVLAVEREHVSPVSPDAPQRLLALGRLENVGLISETDGLTFGATGVTLIYGQNAVGKSSYVRALKMLCRNVDRDCKIRGNVYDVASSGREPSAHIKIEADGAVAERRTKLGSGAAVTLAGLSVFDSACAELYLTSQNTVQYIPSELRLLARLGALQDRMRRDITAERQALREAEPSRDAYPPTTEVGRLLARLRGIPEDPNLASLAVLSAGQASRIAELRGIIAAAVDPTSRDNGLAARREAEEADALAAAVAGVTERTTDGMARRLRTAVADDERARTAVRLAAELLGGPVPGLGDGPWRMMWDAARNFVEGHGGVFPPAADDHCPLCVQAVTVDTAARMARFHEHVSSQVQATAKTSAAVLTEAMQACAPGHVDGCRVPLLATLHDREPELGRQVEGLIDSVAEHLTEMQGDPRAATGAAFDFEAVTAGLTAWANSRSRRADVLLTAVDQASLKQAEAELAELEARQHLASELDVFTAWRTRLGMISVLDKIHSALATNRITSAQRELTETEIGKALDAALTEELVRLSCTHLPVELNARTQVAETKVSLRLLAHEPTGLSEVVSEGERRALALSFFFAELTVTNDPGGIIFDDPVSSLDDDRRGYITDRLVKEAQNRQVIVFTHDLPFVFEIRSRAKKAGIPVHFQHMWRLGDVAGRIDDHPPFKTMNLRERIGKLDQELLQTKTEPAPSNYEQAWRQANGFYHRLRTSWERAIEERLFAGVVERFERDVKTLQLRNVKITDELIGQVEQGMTRASTFLHEDAFAAQVALPSLAEMAQDMDKLRDFERATRPSGR